jgi:hypothetical protein
LEFENMTLNRWKILACSLTIGVGGLAVFATPPTGDKTEPPKEPTPLPTSVKPAVPPTAADTPAPVVPVKAEEFDLPSIPTPNADAKSKPTTEPVFEPIAPPAPLILKASGEDVKAPPVVVPPVPMIDLPPVKPIAPPAAPKTETPPPVIDLDIPIPAVTKPAPLTSPPKPEVVTPIAPPAATKSDYVPPIAPLTMPAPVPPLAPPVSPLPPSTPPAATKATDSAKLKMLLRMGDGQPRFEIRNTTTTELLLKVYGEKIEMQAPPESRSSVAGVTAIGRVRFTAPGIEGTCDHLTILSATGEVLLKGNIRMKTKHGKSISEMTAEKMVYQIGTSGLATRSMPPVRPASYIPD